MVLFLSIGENGGQGIAGKLVAVVGLFEERKRGWYRKREEEEAWVIFFLRGIDTKKLQLLNKINCFNYWRNMCITDEFESNSVTGGSLALLAEYLIHYTITDGFTSLSKEKACAFTLLADLLHYWRNI